MLDDMGLAATLDWFLKGFSERTGIPVEFVHSGMEERPAPEVETCLFRVVQEATTNIARHAAATSCRVYLQRLPASVVLTVEDNGAGFEPRTAQRLSRKASVCSASRNGSTDARGTFRIESAPGRGTRYHGRTAGPEPAGPAGCRRRARGRPTTAHQTTGGHP